MGAKNFALPGREGIRKWLGGPDVQEKALIAFKIALSVCIGTQLSMINSYAETFRNRLLLNDQVIITILGGAAFPLGGFLTQFIHRYIVGLSFGSLSYTILSVLGGSPVAQGFVFFIIVFIFTLSRSTIPQTNVGLLFATLASVYGVDDSYRGGNHFSTNRRGLRDLAKAWSLGMGISFAVNVLIFPILGSRRSRTRTAHAIDHIGSVIDWLSSSTSSRSPIDDIRSRHSPLNIRKTLHSDLDVLNQLHSDLSAEIAWHPSNLKERKQLLDAIQDLQKTLLTAMRNGQYLRGLTPDLESLVRPTVERFSRWASLTLQNTSDTLRKRKGNPSPVAPEIESKPVCNMEEFESVVEKARVELEPMVLDELRAQTPSWERLSHLDKATHCLDTIETLSASINRVHSLVVAESLRPPRLQFYFLSHLRTLKIPFRLLSLPSHQDHHMTILPPLSPFKIVHSLLLSNPCLYAFKVAGALSCLLGLLWSATTRPFFLEYAIRQSTVPLLLSLMPTLGMSVLSWTAQLGGQVGGALWASFIMWLFFERNNYGRNGVGWKAGVWFFELAACLAVGWRMGTLDLLAITLMNAVGVFIDGIFQLSPNQTVTRELEILLIQASVAIAFAIPFQLLLFPRPAREAFRTGSADTLRKLAKLALDEVDLSSNVVITGEKELVRNQQERLAKEVEEFQASLREQDSLVEQAAVEYSSLDSFDCDRSYALVEALHRCVDVMASHINLCSGGPISPRIQTLMGDGTGIREAAVAFGQAASINLWTLGASWSLFCQTPFSTPSLGSPGKHLLYTMEPYFTHVTAEEWYKSSPVVRGDLRRWWSLTLSLVTQRIEIEAVGEVMSPTWRKDQAKDGSSNGVGSDGRG